MLLDRPGRVLYALAGGRGLTGDLSRAPGSEQVERAGLEQSQVLLRGPVTGGTKKQRATLVLQGTDQACGGFLGPVRLFCLGGTSP